MRRVVLRPVSLKSGHHLHVMTDDGMRPLTKNVAWGQEAATTVDMLLAEPFGHWYVATTTRTIQLRVTKRGAAQIHREPTTQQPGSTDTSLPQARGVDHDRAPAHLLDPADPLFTTIGATAVKRRQVDAFLRSLIATLNDDDLPDPLTIVDLGCGNAYLTFATYRYLSRQKRSIQVTGVDIREDQRVRNTALADSLGYSNNLRFVAGTIADVAIDTPPDIVLALHACDTATDDALARAIQWRSRWILAAPCCHHEIATQLRRNQTPAHAKALMRSGILRERFADVLTDALRASLLRVHGYHVDVVEFIDSVHTPRNVLIRARRTNQPNPIDEYHALTHAWGVTPSLERLLPPLPTSPAHPIRDGSGRSHDEEKSH